MKKLMIASAIAMTMTAGSAMAADQQSEVQFFGVVTSVTCDIDSSVNSNATNIVQLGSVAVGAEGAPVDFSLKAQDPNGAGCKALAGRTATIAFLGALGDNGLENGTGTATKAHVALKTLNGKTTAEQEIKKGSSSVEFEGDKLISGEGYQFQAKLVSESGGTEGTFDSALAYAVIYK
ncbi:fimbrial protein [Salmonella enterica]|nr:fimbrial protein [Salmonella enterica]EJW5045064.1 fimbrial protein [Salmonella enterica]